MKNFIFDRYGYYVENGEVFSYQGFKFALEINNYSPIESEDMNNYIIQLSNNLFNKKAYIVPSREDKLLTLSEYGNVSLVAVEDFKVTINDIILFHQQNFSSNKKVKASVIKERWISKLDLIENKIVPSIKIEDHYYQLLVICVTHSVGLAINAIQYLQDAIIDFDDEINGVTLVHKRATLNSYDLLNPFNLIIDSPVRDFAELYKNEEISLEELISILTRYQFNSKDVTLLLARILYPTKFFDLLEKHYQKRDDITPDLNEYYENITSYIDKIKKIHSYLVNNYGIRKINWLE